MQNPETMSGLEAVIVPRAHDLGGFEVRRALPSSQRQMVGPFVFFDQMGLGEFLTGRGLDVRPHPHIGLATVTYLFDGSILHRDSLGTQQSLTPGDVNWMTAGQGITHSERTDAAERTHSNRLFGIQSWVALPRDAEEAAPDFAHHPAATLPVTGRRRHPPSPGRRGGLGPVRARRHPVQPVLCRRPARPRRRRAPAGCPRRKGRLRAGRGSRSGRRHLRPRPDAGLPRR